MATIVRLRIKCISSSFQGPIPCGPCGRKHGECGQAWTSATSVTELDRSVTQYLVNRRGMVILQQRAFAPVAQMDRAIVS
jgi:hypothetical protein